MSDIEMNVPAQEVTMGQVPAGTPTPEMAMPQAQTPPPAEAAPQKEPEAPINQLSPEAFKQKALKYSKKTVETASKETTPKQPKKAPEAPVKEEISTETKPEENQFQPNFKYSALGKEYELPKWAQAGIKDPESEAEVKEVFQKAAGLEHVKMRHQELYGKHTELKGAYDEFTGEVQSLKSIYREAIQKNDPHILDEYWDRLKIPQAVILNYAAAKLQLMELPPEQQQIVQGNITAQRRARDLEMQNQALSQDAQAYVSQLRSQQLSSVLERPDVSNLVQAFESSPGRKPGDFFEQVRRQGEYVWLTQKVDLTPEQAVEQVIDLFRLKQAQQTASAAVSQAQQPTTQSNQPAARTQATPVVPAGHRDVPTIPNVAGKSSSPLKAKPKSLEDLKKLRSAIQ
jgi:hypothetical protein